MLSELVKSLSVLDLAARGHEKVALLVWERVLVGIVRSVYSLGQSSGEEDLDGSLL